jgi:HPt (histidine-containing phosphotransfer) domain-containing protein
MPCNAETIRLATIAEAAPDPEAIDLPGLLNRCMGDRSLARQLLQMFQQRAPAALEQIEAHLAGGESARGAALAHGLKGEAGNMGAIALHRAASALELLLRSKACSDSAGAIASVRTATHDVLRALPAVQASLVREDQATSSI